jgi:hypothetical protein
LPTARDPLSMATVIAGLPVADRRTSNPRSNRQ